MGHQGGPKGGSARWTQPHVLAGFEAGGRDQEPRKAGGLKRLNNLRKQILP